MMQVVAPSIETVREMALKYRAWGVWGPEDEFGAMDYVTDIDVHGNKVALPYVSAAKVAVPRVTLEVTDRAIQVHGGAGVGHDVPLAAMYGWHRAMRIFDGPDELPLRTIAKTELRRTAGRRNAEPGCHHHTDLAGKQGGDLPEERSTRL